MTGALLATALVERGLEPSEHDAKARLFTFVLERHAALGPARHLPVRAWWVPGRLEVFGKHTDYAGGRTLVCAVPRGFAVTASRRDDGLVNVIDARNAESVTLRPPFDEGFAGWRNYVRVVARRLARNFPGSGLGADIVFSSDLPRASGMSSSSALMISVATVLVRLAALESRGEWTAEIRSPLDAAGYYACVENGLSFGSLAGDSGVGTHGGSEDHAAILTGQPGRLSAFRFVPMRPDGTCRVPDEWRFVLAASGVPSEKTGAAKDRYNRLSLGTRTLLDWWNRTEPRAESLGAALGSRPAAVDRLREIVRCSEIEEWTSDALIKRLDHFIREDARVPDALAAFEAADAARLRELATASQEDAETVLENQIAATAQLARSARELGAIGACGFGAGFGGSVWAVVRRADADTFASRWSPHAFIAAPGPPLSELTGSDL
jgi:galactokinase